MTDGADTHKMPTSLADDRYRVVEVLGVGGMATVYRAFDTRLDVERAVKVLAPVLAAREALRRRFETEARTMAKLFHPNIVTVHDVASDGELVFIVMELVEGGSLRDMVERDGPLPARMASAAMQAVLSALQLAHTRGVIHRDIKPHNILLTRDGVPKVTDFGIAHVEDSHSGLTRTGAVMGTWAFMAPEQRSSARKADARSDIYAVGATLYSIVTNKEPFDLYATELHRELFAPVPESLREVIKRATRYHAEERFASAAEMLAALRAAHEGMEGDTGGIHLPSGPATGSQEFSARMAAVTSSRERSEPSSATIAPAFFDAPGGPPPVSQPTISEADGTEPAPPAATPRWVVPALAALACAGLAIAGVTVFWPAPTAPEPEPELLLTPSMPVIEAPEPPAPVQEEVAVAAPEPEPVKPASRPSSSRPRPETAARPTSTPEPAPATTQAASASAPVAAKGTLFINSRPWSSVKIDGAARGRTGWKGDLPAGTHELLLETADGRKASQKVEVRASADTRFCWDFDQGTPCSR